MMMSIKSYRFIDGYHFKFSLVAFIHVADDILNFVAGEFGAIDLSELFDVEILGLVQIFEELCDQRSHF